MLPETVERFLNISNIVAIKEAIETSERIKTLVNICIKINILSDDLTANEGHKGGKGVTYCYRKHRTYICILCAKQP